MPELLVSSTLFDLPVTPPSLPSLLSIQTTSRCTVRSWDGQLTFFFGNVPVLGILHVHEEGGNVMYMNAFHIDVYECLSH